MPFALNVMPDVAPSATVSNSQNACAMSGIDITAAVCVASPSPYTAPRDRCRAS